ncbi:Rho GTPase-activating protein isoform 2 [Schistosoma japonicum]|uniref:Rho GTPase-activating protein isoform 2 n=1 Tax=Schistosoma japonicum TaxID=6182 RepID=A0A4Z2DYF6_SCHJA|nr:Rho GTPase-activating protein isoform 2 [Schistosoma japonicum]
MPNCSHLSQVHTKLFTVSVIGLPCSGKSCVCNRFVFRHPDLYTKDHHSITNDSGSQNVDGDCWLYWGCVYRQIDEDIVKFQIVEYTKFSDCVSRPPPSYKRYDNAINEFLDYVRKSIEIRLLSKNKLTYAYDKYACESLNIGSCVESNELEIDGFILICDASNRASRTQCVDAECLCNSTNLQELSNCFSKVRKPAVLVLSKLDNCDASKLEGLDVIQKSNELKKIPVIGTSAHVNVNIEEAFLTLYKLMDSKVRVNKLRHIPYAEAVYKRGQVVDSATHSFTRLVFISLPEFLTDWETFMVRYSHHADVVNYIELVGSSDARYKFESVVKERFRTTKLNLLNKISRILMHLLPDLDDVYGFSFEQIVSYIRRHEAFSLCFQDNTYYDCGAVRDHSLRNDTRVPFHLVIEPIIESENCPLKQHVDHLANIKRRHTEKAFLETSLFHGFRSCRTSSLNEGYFNKDIAVILPGQPLSDVKSNISSLDLLALTKEEISVIYKQFQLGLHIRAREDFLDLLVEQTGLFVKTVLVYLNHLRDNYQCITYALDSGDECFGELSSNGNSHLLLSRTLRTSDQNFNVQTVMPQYVSFNQIKYLSAPPRGVKETQITWLSGQLSVDSRYQAMVYLPSERQTLIIAYFDLLIPAFDYNRFISRSLSNDIFTMDFKVQTPRNSVALSEMDSPVTDDSSCIDLTSDYRFENLQLESSSVCSPCSSISCGGCMDVLFKHLAYEFFSSNNVFSKEQSTNSSEINSNYFCVNKRILSIPKSNISQERSLSYLPSSTYDHSPLILSIAVACICTDTLAAHAIINLLSCAGFCIFSFTSKTTDHSIAHWSEHYHDYHQHYQQHINLKTPTLSALEETGLSNPLVLTATWPLPTARLLFTGLSTAPISVNSSNTPEMNSSNILESHKIYDGQVQVDLMSHHTLLNKLLSYRENVTNKYEQPEDILLEENNMDSNTVNSSFLPYSGLILITSAPSTCDMEQDNELSQETIAVFSRMDSSKSHDAVDNKRNVVNSCEINIRECSSSPNLLSNINHSPSETECDPKVHIEYDHHPEFPCSLDQLCCMCCKLFCNKKETTTLGCVCGQCCNCMHSLKNCNNSGLAHFRPDPSKDKRLYSGLICPHRRRSWKARIAAINAIVNQIPKNIPHLVLLAESPDGCGKSENKSTLDLPTSIYPASESVGSSTFSSRSFPDTPCDGNANSPSPSNHEYYSPDWMPVGTNILDHVISFLNHCWNKMSQNVPFKHLEKHKATTRRTPSNNSEILNSSNSRQIIETSNNTIQYSTEMSLNKSSSGGLLNTLSIASATGRKAVQSANQALRKLSNSTKCHHNCKSSSANNSNGFPSSIDVHSNINTNENTEIIHEQVSFLSNSKSKISESMCPMNIITTCNSSVTTTTSPSVSQVNRSSGEYNHAHKKLIGNGYPVQWTVGSSSVRTCRKESYIRKATEILQNKGFHFKKIKNDKAAFPPTTLSNLVTDSNQSLLPIGVHGSEKESNCLHFDTPITKFYLANSPDKHLSCENHRDILCSNKNSYIGLLDKWYCISDGPEDNRNVNKFDTRQVDIGSPSDTTATPINVSTLSYLSICEDSTKELLKPVNELENSSISTTTVFIDDNNTDNLMITSKSSYSNHDCPIYSPLNGHSNDMLCAIHQIENEKQDDVESIYEELIPIKGLSPQPTSSPLSASAGTGTNNAMHHSNDVMLPTPTTPINASNIDDEHIYMEPVDCLSYGCLERYHIIPQKFKHFDLTINTSSVIVSNKQELNNSTSSIYSTSSVSSSNVSDSWIDSDVGCRHERYRSFSTPEGSSLSYDDNQTQYIVDSGSSVISSSNVNFSRNIPHPFCGNHLHYCSLRSNHPNGSHHELHLNSSSNTSPLKTRIHSTDAVFGTLTHYSTPIISSASLTLSEDLNENIITNSNKFLNFSTVRAQSLPNPLSRSHHHHFWHHPKCPHYRIHRDSEDSGLGTASSSSSKFGCQQQFSTDFNHINYDYSKINNIDAYRNSFEFLSQQIPCKSYSPTDSCRFCSCCHCTTSYNNSSSSNSSIPSKPVFIDPTDFPTHYPESTSLTFPSHNNFLSVITTSSTTTTTNTTSITHTSSRDIYRRNTYYQPTQSSCNHISSTDAATKDFKRFFRNKPLKFFGHRLSLAAQPHLSPPSISAPNVPQSTPSSDSFPFPFVTPKKSMSIVSHFNPTVHSKPNLSTNYPVSTSLHFETQKLPRFRYRVLST